MEIKGFIVCLGRLSGEKDPSGGYDFQGWTGENLPGTFFIFGKGRHFKSRFSGYGADKVEVQAARFLGLEQGDAVGEGGFIGEQQIFLPGLFQAGAEAVKIIDFVYR